MRPRNPRRSLRRRSWDRAAGKADRGERRKRVTDFDFGANGSGESEDEGGDEGTTKYTEYTKGGWNGGIE